MALPPLNRFDNSFLTTGQPGNLRPPGRFDIVEYAGRPAIRIAYTDANVADAAGDLHGLWGGPAPEWVAPESGEDAIRVEKGEELYLQQDVAYSGDWKSPPTVDVFATPSSPSRMGALPLGTGWRRQIASFTITRALGYMRYRLRVKGLTPGETPITPGGTGYIYVTEPFVGSAPLSENFLSDPYFDQQMTYWGAGGQGGSTQRVKQGITDLVAAPGHKYSFGMGPYAPGAGNSTGGPLANTRPVAKKGDVMVGSAWIMRSEGNVNPDAVARLQPWRAPNGTATVAGTMAQVYLKDLPVGEWYELTGSWTFTEDTAEPFIVAPRMYMYSGSGGWPNDAAGLYLGHLTGFLNPPPSRGGVTEAGVSTTAREGLVSDIFVRSREKIEVQLAQPDEQLIAGERIELAAFAATSSEVSWTWRQVTGPTVTITRKGNTAHFIAPDVDRPTDLRVACRAASTDGANRSNWHFFDLTIQPPRTRWIPDEGADFTPRSPQLVGYDRGKREIWNDVTLPNGMDPNGRWESVLRDLGVPADDVQFVTDGEPPARAAAGGVYIDIETGEVFRNFGAGYNESDDTEGAPRRNAYMVNPATGDIFEWREEGS